MATNIDGIISVDEYKLKTHNMLFTALVKTKCGKVFQVLKTTQGFAGIEGFYITPNSPLRDGTDQVAIRKYKEDVVEYLETEGWLDYKKMIEKQKN